MLHFQYMYCIIYMIGLGSIRKVGCDMLKWLIVADSSCDVRDMDTGSSEIGFETVPFLMRLNQTDYVDDLNLKTDEVVELMEQSDNTCTACPSPELWADVFSKAENVIAVTISGRLSGSYDSAMIARSLVLEEHPEKRITVVDSKSTGPKLAFMLQAILCQIQAKQSFDFICNFCGGLVESVKTLFALSNFHNLVQKGRMKKVVGFVANQLGIRIVGEASKEGEIHVLELIRGERRALRAILDNMEKAGFDGVSAIISHCFNEQAALQLRDMIVSKWQNAVVQILPTRGLDSYYAEKCGLIVGYQTA